MHIPHEIHVSILESNSFTSSDLLKLALSCRLWAKYALSYLWRARKFVDNDSLQQFKSILSKSNQLNLKFPYGEYVVKIQLEETDTHLSLCIDANLIIFLANTCPNLKELHLRFSTKPRSNKSWKLPLNLLSSRLIRINLTTYEHVVDDVDASEDENELSIPHNIARTITNYLFTTSSNQKQINNNSDDTFDALCEVVHPGNINSIRLYNPRMTLNIWDRFTQCAGNSLLSIRIILNHATMTFEDPSEIAMLFGKYCKNLRQFDLESLQCPPISKSAMSFMFNNCLKLENIDAPISGEVLDIIHTSNSLKSISFSDLVEGQSLKATFKMNSLQYLCFLKIDGPCDFSFLEKFPNLQWLSIWDFASFNNDTVRKISQSSITKLDLLKPTKISDEALATFASMIKLINFTIRDRLPNVTQDGWLSFVNRPVECPSWVYLSIGDGRKINTKFFEVLDKKHENLENLIIRGLTSGNLDDSVMQGLKFADAWKHSKESSHLHLNWPIKKKKTNAIEQDSYKSY